MEKTLLMIFLLGISICFGCDRQQEGKGENHMLQQQAETLEQAEQLQKRLNPELLRQQQQLDAIKQQSEQQ